MYPVLAGELKYNPALYSNLTCHENRIIQDEIFHISGDLVDPKPSFVDSNESCLSSDSLDVPDFRDAYLKFMSDILLEEDLEEIPTTVQDFRALQATEKSLYDVLGENHSPSDGFAPSLDQTFENPYDVFGGISNRIEGYANGGTNSDSKGLLNQTPVEPFLSLSDLSQSFLELNCPSSGSSNSEDLKDGAAISPVRKITSVVVDNGGGKDKDRDDKVVSRSRRKKNHKRDVGAHEGGRSNKQQALSNEEYLEMKQYDDILLTREEKDDLSAGNEVSEKFPGKDSKGKLMYGKKTAAIPVEEADLKALLTRCAQAVSNFDLRVANECLKQIRQHSSPCGDGTQRLAHYFANGLEARLAGTGSTISANIVDACISSADFVKAYGVYISTNPLKIIPYLFGNDTIRKLADKATRVHIIHFGVLLGLQWPCFIQDLAKRPGGPPKLRITGVESPQQGFRPTERVEATGHRLTGYCERFNVPFQYQAIVQKWDSLQPEDFKIEDDELVIINCMFRSEALLDEIVEEDSQKDTFLKLVKQLNPSLFIHGVLNGTLNAPFFINRFREALFYYSSIFDMFEETIPRGGHERLLIESEIHAKEALNVIACEGSERTHRPETYKQWQERATRAGLKQLPLDRELLDRTKATVKAKYHKDFVVDEDKNWMLQGWKGRTLSALSLWQSS